MFGLFDPLAWLLWVVGVGFQGVAKCIGSQALRDLLTKTRPSVGKTTLLDECNKKIQAIRGVCRPQKTSLDMELRKEEYGDEYGLYIRGVGVFSGLLCQCNTYLDGVMWALYLF